MESDVVAGAVDTQMQCCILCNRVFAHPVGDANLRPYIHNKSELQQVEDTFFTVFDILPEHKGKISITPTPDSLPFCVKCGPLVRNLVKLQKRLEAFEFNVKRARDEIVAMLAKSRSSDGIQGYLNQNPNFQLTHIIYEKWRPEIKNEPTLSVSGDPSKIEAISNGGSSLRPKPQPHRLSREMLSITKRDEADKLLLSMTTEDSEEVTCQLCSKVCRSKEYLETHLRVHEQSSKLTCSFCEKTFPWLTALKKHLKTQHDHIMEVVEAKSLPEAVVETKVEPEPEKTLPIIIEEPKEHLTEKKTVDFTKVATAKAVEPEEESTTTKLPEPKQKSRRNSVEPTTQSSDRNPRLSDDRLPPKLVDQTRFDLEGAEMEYEDEEWDTVEYENGAEEEEGTGDEYGVEEDPMIDPSLFLSHSSEKFKFKYTSKSLITGYHCKMCLKNYATTSTLKKHVHVVHLKQKRLVCPLCRISVGDHYTLTKHVLRHDPTFTRVVFNCSECGEGAITRRTLERHYANSHPNVKIPAYPMVRALKSKDPLDIEIIKSETEPDNVPSTPKSTKTVKSTPTPTTPATEVVTTDEESSTLITPAAAASAVVPVVTKSYVKKKKPKCVFLYKRKRRHWRRGAAAKSVIKAEPEAEIAEQEEEITVTVTLTAPGTEVETVETDSILIKEAQEKNPYLKVMNFNSSLILERCDLPVNGMKPAKPKVKTYQPKPRTKRSVSPKKCKTGEESPEVVPPVLITRHPADWKSKGDWFTLQKSATLSALTKSTVSDGEKSTPVSLPANWKSFGANSNSLIKTTTTTTTSAATRSPAPASVSSEKPNALLHAMLSASPKSLSPISSPFTLTTLTATNSRVSSSGIVRPKTPIRILPAPPKQKTPEGNKSGYWADPSNILLGSSTSTTPSFFQGIMNQKMQSRGGGPGSPTKTKKLAAIAKSLKHKAYPASVAKTALQSNMNKLVRNVKKTGIGSVNAIPFGKGNSNSESPMDHSPYGPEGVESFRHADPDSGLPSGSARPSSMGFNFANKGNDDDDDYIDPSQFLQVESSTDDQQDAAQFLQGSTGSFRNDIQALLRNPNVKVSMVPPAPPCSSKPGPACVTRVVSQSSKSSLPSGIKLVTVEDVLKGNTRDLDPLLSSPPTKKRLILPKVPPTSESGISYLSDFITVVSSNKSASSSSAPKSTGIPLSQIYESDHLDIEEVEEEEEEFSPIRIRSIQSLREPEPQSSSNNFAQELAEDVEQYQPRIVTAPSRPQLNIKISQVRPQQGLVSRNVVGATPVMLPPIVYRPRVQGQVQNRMRLPIQCQPPNQQVQSQYQARNRQTRPHAPMNRKYRADEQKGVIKYSDYIRNKNNIDHTGQGTSDINFQLPIRTSAALQLQTQPASTSSNKSIFVLVPTQTPANNSIVLATGTGTQSFSQAGRLTTPMFHQVGQNLVQLTSDQNQIDIDPFVNPFSNAQ